MDFEKILEYRQNYAIFSGSKDGLYDAIIDGSYESDYVLLTMSIINNKATQLFENRYTDMIIQITSPIPWTATNFVILHFTSTKPLKLLTGIFKGKVCKNMKKKPQKNNIWYSYEEKTDDFLDFIKNINDFIQYGTVEREDLNINDYSLFDINNLNPYYYTKQAIKIRKELQESNFKILKEIATIITSPTNKDVFGKYIDSKHFTYPLEYEKLPETKIQAGIKIVKGDIIGLLVGEQPKFYLYNNNFDDVYIKATNYCIIRVNDKNINNYIFNYLNSDKARLFFASSKKGSYIPVLSKHDLENLKIIYPTADMIKNADEAVECLLRTKKLSIDEINELMRNAHKTEYKNESQKMINDEILSSISKIKNRAIRELINDDLNEVEICCDNKAYKSAIILCGSVLEAILLDWLSEYENANDILDVAKDNDGKDLQLNNIINKLKQYIRPYWRESKKAHEIRITRNMVHPKECIKKNIKVTYEECRRIVDDLNDILDSKDNK